MSDPTPMSSVHEPRTFTNLSAAELIEHALKNNEGYLADTGALCTATGSRTGRSPNDRYIVDEGSTRDAIDWGAVNKPISPEIFNALWEKLEDHVYSSDHYVAQLEVGDHPEHSIPIEVTTKTAWHSLFALNMFVRNAQFNARGKEVWKVLHAADFVCNPEMDGTHSDAAVIIHFAARKVLLAGMRYAGELKKALFSVQNFLLPEKDVLPMHCAANVGKNGDVSLFFGLSGTGKTTLSADPARLLLGDDEHGWGKDTVFNFEGGCYAKTIDLNPEHEPLIYKAIRFGAIVENVVHDSATRKADYYDTTLSENGRVSYPLEHIAERVTPSRAGEPNTIIFLTCDVLGVLPPVAKLSPEAAAYHFISGYTAKVGSTEIGAASGVKPAFSACFGAPFMPRPAKDYARLLIKRIADFGSQVYLINTGWSGGAGGPGGEGKRFPIAVTRAIITAVQAGHLDKAQYTTLAPFNLLIPTAVPGVDAHLLNPRATWHDAEQFDQQAHYLAEQFVNNMHHYDVDADIIAAGPQ